MDKPRITIRLDQRIPENPKTQRAPMKASAPEIRTGAKPETANRSAEASETIFSRGFVENLKDNGTTFSYHVDRKSRGRGWYRSPWFRMGMAVFSAAGLGVVLGFVVLSVFVNGNLDSKAVLQNVNHNLHAPSEIQQEGQRAGQPEGQQKEIDMNSNSSSAATPAPISLNIPEKTLYMVQAGVFSNPASAEPAVSFFHSKNWPIILTEGDAPRLFAGVAGQQAEAAEIARYYKEQNVEIFVKEWKVPGVNLALGEEQAKSAQQLKSFLLDGQALLEQISAANVRGLRDGMQVEQAEWSTFIEKHRRFLQAGREGLHSFPAEVQKLGEQMSNDMTRAITAMEGYRKQPVVSYLWQAQQGLLSYIAGYDKLLVALK